MLSFLTAAFSSVRFVPLLRRLVNTGGGLWFERPIRLLFILRQARRMVTRHRSFTYVICT
jgi:hypothetical protein